MGVVIKGKSRGGAANMAAYATAQGKNELSEIMEANGEKGGDVRAAFAEMEAVAKGTQCGAFLYHAQINPEKGDHLTPKQWGEAVNTLEKELKLEGHQRVVFRHVRDGREHYHVVWCRIHPDKMKAANMGHNYRAHERAAVKIEKACGLEPIERRPNLEGGRKDERAPQTWEYKQAEHTGINPRLVRAEVGQLQEQTRNGKEFAAALRDMGYTLAKGKKCAFVLFDRAGGLHNLRECTGQKAADLRDFMADLDHEKLPTTKAARAQVKGELKDNITQLKMISGNGKEFAAALKDCGFIVAQGDKRDFVLVDEGGGTHALTRCTGMKAAALRGFMSDLDPASLSTVEQAKDQAKERQASTLAMHEERPETELKQIYAAEERQALASSGTAKEGEKLKLGSAALKTVEAAADIVLSAVDALLGQPEPRKITPADYLRDVKARQAYNQQKAEEAAKEERRGETLDALRGGQPLDIAMLSTLARADLETLKAQGVESGIQEIIRQQERYYERERER